MISKKDEIIWEVDEFPPEPDSPSVDHGLCSVSTPPTPFSSQSPQQPTENVSVTSPTSGATAGPPPLAVPVSAATPPPLASFSPPKAVETTPVPLPPSEVQPVPPPIPAPADTAAVVTAPVQPPRPLVRGERLDLRSLLFGESQITFELLGPNPSDVKFLCLGLDEDERLLGPEYCVGPRQPSSPCGSILYQATAGGGHSIVLCPSSLPTNLKRLEFSAVAATSSGIVGSGATGVRIRTSREAAESSDLSPDCAASACATLLEVYERRGEWRLRVIGAVLADSVDELLKKHGAARRGLN
jgi:stress response protein SCP2